VAGRCICQDWATRCSSSTNDHSCGAPHEPAAILNDIHKHESEY